MYWLLFDPLFVTNTLIIYHMICRESISINVGILSPQTSGQRMFTVYFHSNCDSKY